MHNDVERWVRDRGAYCLSHFSDDQREAISVPHKHLLYWILTYPVLMCSWSDLEDHGVGGGLISDYHAAGSTKLPGGFLCWSLHNCPSQLCAAKFGPSDHTAWQTGQRIWFCPVLDHLYMLEHGSPPKTLEDYNATIWLILCRCVLSTFCIFCPQMSQKLTIFLYPELLSG